MRIIRNSGNERVIELLRPGLRQAHQLDLVTESLSLFAFEELSGELAALAKARLIMPADGADLGLLGATSDRASRNRLRSRWLAARFAEWIEQKVEVRQASGAVPQGAAVVRDGDERPKQAIFGSFSFSTGGLGMNHWQSAEPHSSLGNARR